MGFVQDLLNNLYNYSPAQIAGTVSLLVPFVVAFLVKEHAPNWIRSVVTLVLTALVTVLSGMVSFTDFDLGRFWQAWFVAFIAALGAYLGIWKPTGAARSVSIATDRASILGSKEAPADEDGVYDVSSIDLDALAATPGGPGADGNVEG